MSRRRKKVPDLAFNEDTNKILKLFGNDELITSKIPLNVQELLVSFSFGFNHLFSDTKCHKNIKLRNNNKTVKMHKKDGWSRRVHCNQIMTTGIHYIEFEINNLTKDISIGISNPNSNIKRFVGFDKNSYSLSCSGKLQHKSDADYTDPFSSHWNISPYEDDDIIGIQLDLNKYTLKYYKNGIDLGIAFNIKNTGNIGYVFAVSMAVKGDMVSIVYEQTDDTFISNTNKSRKRELELEKENDILFMPPQKKRKTVRHKSKGKEREEIGLIPKIAMVKKRCRVKCIAIKVLHTLNIPSEFMDSGNDKCFCNECHNDRRDNIAYMRGKPPQKYVLPINWTRFGLVVDKGKCKMNNVWDDWHVAYHGTSMETAKAIFKSGLHLLKPGDSTIDGFQLAVKQGHIHDGFKRYNKYICQQEEFDPNQIFVSPSIKYSSMDLYAQPFYVDVDGRKIETKCVFQLRIRPNSYGIGQETIGADDRYVIDENFSNNQLEWYTKENVGIVVHGLLIKISNH